MWVATISVPTCPRDQLHLFSHPCYHWHLGVCPVVELTWGPLPPPPQPHISSYSGEVMPLLLAYLKSVPPGHTHHLAKACYALENFVENLGSDGSWGAREGMSL